MPHAIDSALASHSSAVHQGYKPQALSPALLSREEPSPQGGDVVSLSPPARQRLSVLNTEAVHHAHPHTVSFAQDSSLRRTTDRFA